MLIIAAFAALARPPSAQENIGKLVLDEQQLNFTNTTFSDLRWDSFLVCMEQASLGTEFSVIEVERAGWRGFIQYGLSNGTQGDPWNPNITLPNGTRQGGWLEYNPQPMGTSDSRLPGASHITITEPCNYNSNVAYYSSMTTMCSRHLHNGNWTMPRCTLDLLIASFATLASGSSFLHGSGTRLGGTMDNVPIGHIALTGYQEAVSTLVNVRGLIADARATPTEPGHNGTDEILAMCQLMQHQPVHEWNEAIQAREKEYQSDYYITFGTIVVLGSRLCLPKIVADELLPVVASVMGLSEADKTFLLDQFDAALQESLFEAGVEVSEEDKTILVRRSAGMLIKMLWAFVWQEQVFKGAWLLSPEANQIGGAVIPEVNLVGDFLTGYWHPLYVRASIGVYPGNALCKSLVAHAKWHEQSANALVDLVFVADDIHTLVLNRPLNAATEPDLAMSGREGFVRASHHGCFDAFLEKGRFAGMLKEVEGAIQCMQAGSKHYNERTGVDTRLSCLSHWALGETTETMDSCLLHNNCLALVDAEAGALSHSDLELASELSFSRVQACVVESCATHVPYTSQLSLASCIGACPLSLETGTLREPEFACAAQCLAQHSKFSNLGAAMVHCAAQKPPPWSTGNSTFDGFVSTAACMGEQLAPVSGFWAAIAHAAVCSAKLGREI